MDFIKELDDFLAAEQREFKKAEKIVAEVFNPVWENTPNKFSRILLTSKIANQAVFWFAAQNGYQPTRDDMPPLAMSYFTLDKIVEFTRMKPTFHNAVELVRHNTYMLSAASAVFYAAEKDRSNFADAYNDVAQYRKQKMSSQPNAIVWIIRILVRRQPNGGISVQGGHHMLLDKPEMHGRPLFKTHPDSFRDWLRAVIPKYYNAVLKNENEDQQNERFKNADAFISESKLGLYNAAYRVQQIYLGKKVTPRVPREWELKIMNKSKRCAGCSYYSVNTVTCTVCNKAVYCSTICYEADWQKNRHIDICLKNCVK
jgi:hypothetical protein